MDYPAKLVRRAALNRRQKVSAQAPAPPEIPAVPAPKHISHHSSYTALMRSHDRVSTRHIAPRSGA